VAVMALFMRAVILVQGAQGTLVERAHSEQGVSTVQYALLMALVALVVALTIALLGSGMKGLFGSVHGCMNGLTTAVCKVDPVSGGSAAQGS
jgi:Flp pilus assembly pilin Flp